MGTIKLENIRVYSYHGCMPEETIIGGYYIVDLTVKANLKISSSTDNLNDTVDYVFLNSIVVEEMSIPSKLLEAVSQRIINRVFCDCPSVYMVSVSVAKLCPPINGDVEKVIVSLERSRSL